MIIVLFYAFKIWDTFLGEGHHVEQSSSDIVVSWFLFAKGVQGCAARSGWHCLNSLWYWSPTESQKVAQTSNIFTFFFYSFGQISGINKQSSFSFHISSVFCIHEYSGLFCAKLQNRLYPHVWWGDTYKCFIFIIVMFIFIFTSTCDEETLIFNIQWTLVSNWNPYQVWWGDIYASFSPPQQKTMGVSHNPLNLGNLPKHKYFAQLTSKFLF